MDIGAHCNYCGRLDFLPFNCHKCGKVVCGDHRVNHDCIKEKILPHPETPSRSKGNNSYSKPQTVKPQPVRSHSQSVKPPTTDTKVPSGTGQGIKLGGQKVKNERASVAFERLKSLIGGSGRSQAPSKNSASPVSNSAVSPVAPAELKKTAIGDHNVKFSDRWYLRVERPAQPYKDLITGAQSTRPAKTMPLFFSKSLTIGQVLDKAAPHLGYNSQGAGFRRMNGSVLDLNGSISSVPQGATLIVTL